MKSIKTILAIFFVAATMTLVGCSKDGDNNSSAPSSLVGTVWSGSAETSIMGESYKIEKLLKFLTATEGDASTTVTEGNGQPETQTDPFTYTYNAPNGTMTVRDDDGETTTHFTVSGNKLALSDMGITIILTRQ